MIGLLLAAAVLSYVALAVVIYTNQEKLLFHPDSTQRSPADVGINNAQVVTITSPDGEKLVAWYTPAAPGKGTILFLHGKGGSIANRPERYAYYTAHGYGVLFLSYRGYGGSSGAPSEAGLKTDARAAYDWLVEHGLPPAQIFVVGESLGTGIATYLASQVQIAALALEAPYASMSEVAENRYWFLPVRLLIRNPIDAGSVIAKYHGPVLMQHGDQDQTIPIAIGRELFALANEPKEFVVVKGADHFIFAEPTFARELAFFDRVVMKTAK